MKPLTTTDLEAVTGGVTSSTSDQLLTAVQGLQSSLKDLSSTSNSGRFGGTNGLLFVAALAMSRRNNVTVVPPGYSYQSW